MPNRRGALWALTRIEGRRLLRHPLFLLGYLFSTIILVVFADGSPYHYWNLIGAAPS